MREAVICEPLRTPVGRYGGVFKEVEATELAATVIIELLRRTGLEPDLIDDVLLGQCDPTAKSGISRGGCSRCRSARQRYRVPVDRMVRLRAVDRYQRRHAGPNSAPATWSWPVGSRA